MCIGMDQGEGMENSRPNITFTPESQDSEEETSTVESEEEEITPAVSESGETRRTRSTCLPRDLTKNSSTQTKGDAFCDCHKRGAEKECKCGEEDSYFEWTWDDVSKSAASYIKEDNREVMFHIDYSCGTAAVRGTVPMKHDQYYWEVKMTTPVYGTDMMIGVCTSHIDLNKCRHTFCSMIGQDSESWGLSYSGVTQHRGVKVQYASKFSQGSIIGIHLDMWHGTLSFYKNRRPLGVAYSGLHGKMLFPIVSSTAARSGMKVIRSCSFPTSLQFMCCQMLRKVIPRHLDVLEVINLPPGLKDFLENNIHWLLQPCPPQVRYSPRKRTRTDSGDDEAGPSGHKIMC